MAEKRAEVRLVAMSEEDAGMLRAYADWIDSEEHADAFRSLADAYEEGLDPHLTDARDG